MLLLLAELHAKPEARAEVEGLLRQLVEVARTEPGNIVYAVHQQQTQPDSFVLYELYRDRTACEAHLIRPPVQQALQRFEALLQMPPRIVFADALAYCGLA
jgi:quinol monooxygenase YgiN